MTDKTKACNLTSEEVEAMMEHHARLVRDDFTAHIERLKYFQQRYKSFSEIETKSEPNAAGWSAEK